MSDADDQMGGTGGETGPRPGGGAPGAPGTTGTGDAPDGAADGDRDDEVTERSKESFPASDPPASY